MRYYALFVIGHDGLHRRVFDHATVNDLFCDLLIFGPVGCITRLNKTNQLAHHRFLTTPEDPDRHKHGCFNKARPLELIGYLTGATSFVRSSRNVLAPKLKEYSLTKQVEGASQIEHQRRRYSLRDIMIVIGWQAVLILGFSWAIGLWAYLALWILPVFCCTFLADNLRSFLEHSQPEKDTEADRRRLISYVSNPIERLFLAPMNMNFHAVHHLWPSIPYYNLPQADSEIRGQPAAAGIEWRASYLAYLWRYMRALPLPECRQFPNV
jgi:fatty acid desaturase